MKLQGSRTAYRSQVAMVLTRDARPGFRALVQIAAHILYKTLKIGPYWGHSLSLQLPPSTLKQIRCYRRAPIAAQRSQGEICPGRASIRLLQDSTELDTCPKPRGVGLSACLCSCTSTPTLSLQDGKLLKLLCVLPPPCATGTFLITLKVSQNRKYICYPALNITFFPTANTITAENYYLYKQFLLK